MLDRLMCLCYALHTHDCAYTMSVQRNHKQTDLEKRLKFLELQLHGKKEGIQKTQKYSVNQKIHGSEIQTLRHTENLIISGSPGNSEPFQSDIVYLKKDLLKIFILSALAISAEFLIYFGSRNNLLRLF